MMARAQQRALQGGHTTRLGKRARLQTLLPTKRRRHAHGLSNVRASSHHPAGSKGDVRCANDAAREKEIRDVPAVETAIRNLVHALGVPLRTPWLLTEHAISRVQVDRPAAVRDRIGM